MEINMGNDLEMVTNEFAIDISDDKAALLAALGQDGVTESKQSGPTSLRINYDADTDDGHTLKRGTWKVWNGSENVYADSVVINPMLRTYEYSIYDQEEGAFTCRSVQRKKMTETFPDNSGGMKCGRLTRSEEEGLSEDDPRLLLSKSVTCNIILYGQLDMANAVNAAGEASPVTNLPFVGYFKRSGFRPINDFVQQKLGNKIPLPTSLIELKTKRMANGGVTYWIPQPELIKEVPFTSERKELMQKFYDTVAAANSKIVGEHKEALKQTMSDEDIDLANRLAG
tara:strand:+ start:2043 stop:2894 length:852 start_codon:yes stop_codon:yes gene_type:complete